MNKNQMLSPVRLDQIIIGRFPQYSLRAARRLISDGRALLNGQLAKPGAKVRPGDKVEIVNSAPAPLSLSAKLLYERENYCFFYKPSGMHTVSLAGRYNENLESRLPELLPSHGLHLKLLQRLDFGTGGIVAAARNSEAEQAFRHWERHGKCKKFYFAILRGHLAGGVQCRKSLDDSRTAVKIRPQDAPEANWTILEPLAYGADNTLALCLINSGQRHQIRAHAASIGHALVGDPLYGREKGEEGFALEHWGIKFPGHDIRYFDENCVIRQKYPHFITAMTETVQCM